MFIDPPHDQEIHFDNNTIRYIRNIIKVESGAWTHIVTEEGVEHIINPDRVLWVRVYGAIGDSVTWKSLIKKQDK